MKIKGIQFFVATGLAILFCSYVIHSSGTNFPEDFAGQHGKDKLLVNVLMESLEKEHYKPKTIDDGFSKNAFNLYLERLDYSKRFLLEQDVAALRMHQNSIDDQLTGQEFVFFDESWALLQLRLKEAKSYYKEILDKPFDFTKDEFIELDEEKRAFASNKDELKDHWRKILKYQVLTRIYQMEKEQEEAAAESDTVTVDGFVVLEEKARKKVLKSQNRFFDRMMKWEQSDQMEVYLNSVINVFGPHTGYFAPKKKENFDISMSGQLEGIGAQLREKDGYITVTRIVPGSASYRQGELEEKDKILKVAQEQEDPVDVTDMRLDDAVKLIRGKKGTVVKLTVKKISGSIKEIEITRDIVVLAETYAKSAVVENEDGTRVGYINLPKFYADFSRRGGRSAAVDVGREIEKLKTENIDGIVLDLRGNGGGSLRDAVDMTGHFIDQGPVVQVKSRYSKPQIMSDRKAGMLYDGPLVVMLNHFSASASEILAAAIQDYDRGIIMGASGSFGKGTVQRFSDLDRRLGASDQAYKPLGSLKVTTQKFYRINGGATQLRGVESDIVMTDRFNEIDLGEREQDFVMEWDEIAPASYTKWQAKYDEKRILEWSDKRMSQNKAMQLVAENAVRLRQQRDETETSLGYEAFKKEQQELDAENKRFKDIMKPLEHLSIENLNADMQSIEADTVTGDLNEKWLKKLKKDVYLDEAVNVIGDMMRG